MMTQEDASDLIETVTAEIEAIIQEEINSQNALASSVEDELIEEIKSLEELSSVHETVETVETVQTEQNQIISEFIEEKEQEEAQEPKTTETEEKLVDISEFNAILVPEVSQEAAVSDPKEQEQFVEYIVNIDSPTQVKDIVAEVISENVSTTETILTDAPIDENDGPRAKHLKQALRKALNNTVKSCSGDKLETCFPFNLKPNQFAQINSTISHALKSVIDGVQAPFDEFLKSENLVDKLNKVDEFTRSRVPGTSEVSQEASIISSLTPKNLIDRKLYTSKLAALTKLEQFTQKLESENSQLTTELNIRQTEFADRLDRLKSSQQLLDAALDQVSSISMNDLEVLVNKMNYQYQPSALKFQNN